METRNRGGRAWHSVHRKDSAYRIATVAGDATGLDSRCY